MNEYRTDLQFEEIVDSVINGNWTQGAEKCVEYGFYAQDLINKQEDECLPSFNDDTDIALVAEMAQERR